MVPEIVMAKVEGAAQASQLPMLTGKSFTVGKVIAAENGLGSWLFLTPDGGAGVAGKGVVAIKLEGTKQMAHLSALVGKSVTVGKSSAAIGSSVGNWLVLHPNAGLAAKGLAGAGAGGKGLAGSQLVMMKLEGATQAAQLPMLQGKTFTVINPSMVGKGAGKWLFLKPSAEAGLAGKDIIALKVQHGAAQLPLLVGQTVTVGKFPIVAGDVGNWLVLHPGTGLATKSVAGTAVAAKGGTVAGTVNGAVLKGIGATGKGVGVATKAGGAKAAASMASGAAATGAKAAAAGGTIWTGNGLSLGLGLGLGVWGPVILGLTAAAAIYGYVRSRRAEKDQSDEELELQESLADI